MERDTPAYYILFSDEAHIFVWLHWLRRASVGAEKARSDCEMNLTRLIYGSYSCTVRLRMQVRYFTVGMLPVSTSLGL